MDVSRFTEQNRKAWNEIAEQREQVRRAPAGEFFARGHITLVPDEVKALGDLDGKRVLHLACASGGETLSTAVLGATAVGVDISDVAIEIARRKAEGARLQVEFVRADMFALPDWLQAGDFDVVFASSGCLAWVPDLTRWTRIVSTALRPGGRLVLHELHPAMIALDVIDGDLRVSGGYFDRGKASVETGPLTGVTGTTHRYDFLWPLGDVITRTIDAGLHVIRLEEYPPASDSLWRERFGAHLDGLLQFPASFLLVAEKATGTDTDR